MKQTEKDPEKNGYLEVIHDKFEAALVNDDDVDLYIFLEGFEELNRFLASMGTAFFFISRDLTKNTEDMKPIFWEFSIRHLYKTVKIMIAHETKYDLVNRKDIISGCRTLLRILKGLEFILLFLKKIGDLQDQDRTSVAATEAYEKTLSKHHSFITRSGTKLGMYFLPLRGNLFEKLWGDQEGIQQAINMLPKTLTACTEVYRRIDTLYTINDLHKTELLTF